MTKILYLFRQTRSFIKRDLEMLSKYYDVTPLYSKGWNLLKIRKGVKNNDIIFVWFASGHAFIATIFARLHKKKIIVVTGGYDVAKEKKIKYGLMNNIAWGAMVKYVLRRADKILAVSRFNAHEVENHTGVKKAIVVYNSVDESYFVPAGEKKQKVLTVGYISKDTIIRKGLKTFVEAAYFLPDAEFVLVGHYNEEAIKKLREIMSSNVTFAGYVDDDELLRHYQEAKVYCQLSYYESYGMAPAEAMLCECIPVVCKRGALKEVVGEIGKTVEYGDAYGTANAINEALKSTEGKKARGHILNNFSQSKREKELKEVIDSVKIG